MQKISSLLVFLLLFQFSFAQTTKTYLVVFKDKKNSPYSIAEPKKYLSEKFTLKINGQQKPMLFLSKEVEDNILICYLKCVDISKITTLDVQNTIITEVHGEQQNIIQANFNNKKSSLLLDSETYKGMLK